MPSTITGTDNFDTSLPFITEQGDNAAGRFRRWSNGYVEQWIRWSTPGGTVTVNLPVAFDTAKTPRNRTGTIYIVTGAGTSGTASAYSYINDGFSSSTQLQIFQGATDRGSVYVAGFLND